ncbi:MAG: hypothetical protein Q7R68_10870 [Nitrospirales bacterium]|nr:hypothetical protein [Nitrospirales bacterium]
MENISDIYTICGQMGWQWHWQTVRRWSYQHLPDLGDEEGDLWNRYVLYLGPFFASWSVAKDPANG